MTTARTMWVGALGLGLAAGAVCGQGPSFTVVPDDPAFASSFGLAISPSGRYIAGGVDSDIGSYNYHDDLFRWDRQAGVRVSGVRTFSFSGVAAADDGSVFGSTPDLGGFGVDEYARVFRWRPELNQFVYVPRASQATADDLFQRVSADGLFAIGMTALPGLSPQPAIYDFSGATPLRVDLSAGEGFTIESGAGVTLPINGLRFAYGNALGNGTRAGLSWPVASAYPSQLPMEVYAVSPDGKVKLAKVGATYSVTGNGADWGLGAVPGIGGELKPAGMSQDGSVVVGLVNPNNPQPVVWRVGQPAATLQSLLGGAGVSTPAWLSASLSGVSADGSVVCGSYYISGVDVNLDFHAFAAVLPAANDNCAGARPVSYGTVVSSTNGATRAGVSSGVLCASEGAAPDVWFSFVPVATESVTIDTCGSGFDTTLAVFQASSCASVSSPIACNDDAASPCAGNVHASRLTASVIAGQNYYIRVSGWNGASGSVQLTITAPNRPANDACAQATEVPPGSGAFWSNVSAVTDARPNCPGTGTPFSDIWFRTVPRENGRMTYRNCSSTINTVLTAFDASACGNTSAAPLACGQNNTACGSGVGLSLTVPCTSGQAQLTRLGGLFGATGSGVYSAVFACDASTLDNYALQVTNHGARAFWRFDDSGSLTVADTIRADPYTCGNYPGEYMPGVVRSNSYMGKALRLDGAGAYARFDTVPQLHINDPASCSAATLEAWINTTDPAAGVVLTSRNDPSQHSLTLVVGYNPIGISGTDGRVMFIADGPGTLFGAISAVRVDNGNWHHIVGRRTVRNATLGTYNYELYVDGLYQGNNNLSGGVGSAHVGVNGQYWTVGNGLAWPSAGAAFNGMIDNVALYCGSLTPTQIVNHATVGAPPPCDSIDFNRDGLFPDTADIDDFLSVFSGGPCSTGSCADIDFNNDGLFPDTADIDDFLRVFSGGPC